MKQVLSLLMVILLLQANAQDSLPVKKRIFKVKVLTVTGQSLSGYLNQATDTALLLSNKKVIFNPYSTAPKELAQVKAPNIQEVYIRRHGTTSRILAIGAAIGMGVGIAAGLISGDDEGLNDGSRWCILCLSAEEKAGLYGLAGGVAGGITGAIIGAIARKKFVIGGQQPKFDSMRLSLLEKIGRVPLQ
ncbi:hypothetical protein HB364_16900 [Pseudoflavitalea sp. X16]|uniref:hypothetical protein n=1 Tax=Paraflavitalea devenefica TaxID=2716334 RepID=UPI0014239E7E|nr:hypothetical protein [Paraflavitalea devenefica]NII26770.1 hypothetical protein [Paraflavitalea devenefica]